MNIKSNDIPRLTDIAMITLLRSEIFALKSCVITWHVLQVFPPTQTINFVRTKRFVIVLSLRIEPFYRSLAHVRSI